MSKPKPFDLEAAKRGEPIMRRNGESMTFGAFLPSAKSRQRVVTVDAEGIVRFYPETGLLNPHGGSTASDLVMVPRKNLFDRWVNFYTGDVHASHDTLEEANEAASPGRLGPARHIVFEYPEGDDQ